MKYAGQYFLIIGFWCVAVFSFTSGHRIRVDFSIALSLLIVALNMAVFLVFHS